MARVTVEDCRGTVPNPFELVLLAAERARSLRVGAAPLVEPGRDATPIVALREIAAGLASPPHLRDLALRRRFVFSVPPTGDDEAPARSELFPDEEPELRYEPDGDGLDEDVEDEDFDDEAALARLVEEEMLASWKRK